MTPLALGLMSGTSADSVTAALVKFKDRSFELVATINEPYPAATQAMIRQSDTLRTPAISRLNMLVGETFGKAALRLLKKTKTNARHVAVIGSHGQTLYHGPNDNPANTFQIGSAAVIAAMTGCPVVSDFRSNDVAAGGEGAPLVPFFDIYFFSDGPVRAFQNIGGIGNVTVVGRGLKRPLAFDTGPGNALMDAVLRTETKGLEPFDRNGARAKKGRLVLSAIGPFRDHPFLQKEPPKSTGLHEFGLPFVDQLFEDAHDFGGKGRISLNDKLATLNHLTALSIQEAYRNFVFKKASVAEVIVSGGGAFNKTLLKKLGCLLAPIPVFTSERVGLPPHAKEAVAFAFFGLRRLQNKINHWPGGTGAGKTCVVGALTYA